MVTSSFGPGYSGVTFTSTDCETCALKSFFCSSAISSSLPPRAIASCICFTILASSVFDDWANPTKDPPKKKANKNITPPQKANQAELVFMVDILKNLINLIILENKYLYQQQCEQRPAHTFPSANLSSCFAFLIARIWDGSDVMIWSSV